MSSQCPTCGGTGEIEAVIEVGSVPCRQSVECPYCMDRERDALQAEIERLRSTLDDFAVQHREYVNASESKVAGLVAVLREWQRWYQEETGYMTRVQIENMTERALTDADAECVPGWWDADEGAVLGHDLPPQMGGPLPPCTVVIHKEQQHGA